MKLFILFFLLSTKLFAAESIQNIKCYFYNDPNHYPIVMLYFTATAEEKIELIVNLREDDFDDEASITKLYQDHVEVNELANKIVVTGKDLYLEMKTPIAYWNHGDARNSHLQLRNAGINTNLVCELQ